MVTHVHFHDFLSDKKPFEEAKHKRSHGRFATMAGPGAQQKPVTKPAQAGGGQSAAQKIAAALAKSKATAAQLAKEAYSVHGDVDILTKGLSSPNTPLRQKVSQALTNNIPEFLAEVAKEGYHTIRYGASGMIKTLQYYPLSHEEEKAFNNIFRKFLITGFKWGVTVTTGIPLAVPGVGAAAELGAQAIGHVAGHVLDAISQHIIEQSANQVLEHVADEHVNKYGGSGARLLLYGARGLRGQRQMYGGGDHAFFDADGLSDQQCMKMVSDFLHELAKGAATVPIDMKKIMATAPKPNGDSGRFGPLFGGLKSSGNRIGDEGTSEGARKGWQHRQHGQSGLRKATPTAPPASKPSFEEMRARAQSFELPRSPKKPKQEPMRPKAPEPVTPERREFLRTDPVTQPPQVTRRVAAPPSLGAKTQAQSFGGGHVSATRTGRGYSEGGKGQRAREHEKLVRGEQAQTAARQQAELRSLHQRRGSLNESEQRRYNALIKEHGAGALSQPTAQKGTPMPAKRFVRGKGNKRWLSRKPV